MKRLRRKGPALIKKSAATRRHVESRATPSPAVPDKLELYRWAVQDPETHALILRAMHQRSFPGSDPIILREDFAGTCAESVAWVILQGGRAIAVDLDGPTLNWAQSRANRLLGSLASRIDFVQADVRTVRPPRVPQADIISVLNYSILYHRTSRTLLSYLRRCLNNLAPEGILVLNLFGGAAAIRAGITRHRITPQPRLSTESPIPPFEYIWEVRKYDAASHQIDCRIHFAVPDRTAPNGSRELIDAFHYEWRLWSPRDLIDACAQAGFSKVELWRHTYDPSKGVDGVFLGPVDPKSLPVREKWSAYIVARR